MRTQEEHLIGQIDAQKAPSLEIGDQGKAAEEVVIEFFKSIPKMDIRPATPAEDSGRKQIVKDLAIDAVGYLDGEPAIGLQVTTATDSLARNKKKAELLDRPFLRLSEMGSSGTAIPRALVFLDAAEVKAFMGDRDMSQHPKLTQQIRESTINSLKLDLMKTKNPREQALIETLLLLIAEQGTAH
jgi:hypothetical protein